MPPVITYTPFYMKITVFLLLLSPRLIFSKQGYQILKGINRRIAIMGTIILRGFKVLNFFYYHPTAKYQTTIYVQSPFIHWIFINNQGDLIKEMNMFVVRVL
jgi:hypothetical protein